MSAADAAGAAPLMPERRQFARLEVTLPVRYTRIEPQPPELGDTLTKDVSAGGVCLYVDSPMAPKTMLEVELDVAPGRRIVFIGVVRWSRGVTDRGAGRQSEIGLQFVKISPEDQRLLVDFVARGFEALPPDV